MKITINLIQQENEFVAVCPELDINCYGRDKSDAIKRIYNVIEFYIESAKEFGFDVNELNEISIEDKPYCPNDAPFRGRIHYQKKYGYSIN